jgi:hypothetical protein
MTNYIWTIKDLFTQTIEDKEDYVIKAIYDVFGSDGTHSAELTNNITYFSTESVGAFIPYDELTEGVVLSWIKETLGESGVMSIESCIQGQIDSQINPPVEPINTPLPWN